MVLLHVLHELSRKHEWKLIVAHFNHQLRGDESDWDELFVRQAAAAINAQFIAERGNVKQFAARTKLSVEMAARELRHAFLAKTARDAEARYIALGHHRDDQLELFLLRLIRDVKGDGLGGMQWQNRSSADAAIELVRPMLGTARPEIKAFAEHRKIPYREDSTNRDLDVQRNWVRHEIVPLLRELKGESVLLRVATLLATENEWLKNYAAAWVKKSNQNFAAQPMLMRQTIIHEQLIAAKVRPTRDLIEALSGGQRRVSVGPNRFAMVDAAGRLKVDAPEELSFDFGLTTVRVADEGEVTFGGADFRWRLTSPVIKHDKNLEYFDAEGVGESVTLRHWQAGDRFQPIGFARPAKLQDLWTGAKVSIRARRKRVLAATASGEIFWVEGLRIGERFKITNATKRALEWSWERK